MEKSRNLPRKGSLMLSQVLLFSALFSCTKKDVQEPPTIAERPSASSSETISASALSANLLYHENADGSSLFGTYVSKQTATTYGITASTSQFYTGTKSARFELRDGDPISHNGTRAEISFPDATNMHRWYSYNLYIPSAQYKYDDDDEVISQWHQGGGTSPALSLRTKAGRYRMTVIHGVGGPMTQIDLGPIQYDGWHSYVFHVKHSAGSDGILEVWRDGVQILNRPGQNAYAVTGSFHMPKWKMGLYKSDWNGSGTTASTQRVLYFDDIKLGNENATYNDMASMATTTPTPTPPTTTTPPATSTLSVESFTLVSAATEKDVLTIANGQTISLSALGLTKVNIRANTSGLGSVKLELSGTQSKAFVDNKAPYALHSDDGNGNYYYGNWNPPALGTYTLKATPYTEDYAKGTVGTSKTITFTITK